MPSSTIPIAITEASDSSSSSSHTVSSESSSSSSSSPSTAASGSLSDHLHRRRHHHQQGLSVASSSRDASSSSSSPSATRHRHQNRNRTGMMTSRFEPLFLDDSDQSSDDDEGNDSNIRGDNDVTSSEAPTPQRQTILESYSRVISADDEPPQILRIQDSEASTATTNSQVPHSGERRNRIVSQSYSSVNDTSASSNNHSDPQQDEHLMNYMRNMQQMLSFRRQQQQESSDVLPEEFVPDQLLSTSDVNWTPLTRADFPDHFMNQEEEEDHDESHERRQFVIRGDSELGQMLNRFDSADDSYQEEEEEDEDDEDDNDEDTATSEDSSQDEDQEEEDYDESDEEIPNNELIHEMNSFLSRRQQIRMHRLLRRQIPSHIDFNQFLQSMGRQSSSEGEDESNNSSSRLGLRASARGHIPYYRHRRRQRRSEESENYSERSFYETLLNQPGPPPSEYLRRLSPNRDEGISGDRADSSASGTNVHSSTDSSYARNQYQQHRPGYSTHTSHSSGTAAAAAATHDISYTYSKIIAKNTPHIFSHRKFLISNNLKQRQAYCKLINQLGGTVCEDSTNIDIDVAIFEWKAVHEDQWKNLRECNPRAQFLTPQWIEACIQAQQMIAPYKCCIHWPAFRNSSGIPAMHNLVVSVTGFVGEERADLKHLIRACGAKYSGALSKRENTHLICCQPFGEKYRKALEWKICVINKRWLYDCIASWDAVPEKSYRDVGVLR